MTMTCEHTRENLSAWLDGELDPRPADELELHLAACGECRAAAEALRGQNAELRRECAPARAAAERIGAVVSERWLHEPEKMPPTLAATYFGHWSALLLAAAAGFLGAVALFQPWREAAPPGVQQPTNMIGPPITAPPIARVVEATGPVEVRTPGESAWQCRPQLRNFACPTDSKLKTGPNMSCEVETSAGCMIRLHEETEVTLTSPDSVAIHRGQIWCRSPADKPLRVRATAPPEVSPPSP